MEGNSTRGRRGKLTYAEYIKLGGSDRILIDELDGFFMDHEHDIGVQCDSDEEVSQIFDLIETSSYFDLGFDRLDFMDMHDWLCIYMSHDEIHFGKRSDPSEYIMLSDILEKCLEQSGIEPPTLPDIMELLF